MQNVSSSVVSHIKRRSGADGEFVHVIEFLLANFCKRSGIGNKLDFLHQRSLHREQSAQLVLARDGLGESATQRAARERAIVLDGSGLAKLAHAANEIGGEVRQSNDLCVNEGFIFSREGKFVRHNVLERFYRNHGATLSGSVQRVLAHVEFDRQTKIVRFSRQNVLSIVAPESDNDCIGFVGDADLAHRRRIVSAFRNLCNVDLLRRP